MEIRCDQCDARLNLPEERLKGASPRKVTCPRCGSGLSLRVGSDPKREDQVAPGEPIQSLKKDSFGALSHSVLQNVEGKRLALVLEPEPEQKEPLQRALEALGYAQVNAEGVRDAMSKLRYHSFDLILLSDRFEDEPWENSPILNYLNSLPIGVRRRMFVALIGDALKTRDPMAAFTLSANLVIGRGHANDLARILKQGVEESEAFYAQLMCTLAELGRT